VKIETAETEGGDWTKGGEKVTPLDGIEIEIGDYLAGGDSFFV